MILSSLRKSLFLFLMMVTPCMAAQNESAAGLLQQGDVQDQKLQPAEALKFYLPAEKLQPADVTLLVRIARQYRHLMADATTGEEKLKFGGLGLSYAQRAAVLAPNDAEAHLSIAISHAKMMPILGNKEKMEASRLVKSEVDKSIALDPTRDLAWHVLGCWHQRLAEIGTVKRAMAKMIYGALPAATNEDAVRCFRKAIALNPSRPIHFVELGRTYAQMGQVPAARQYIQKGLDMTNVGKDDSEVKQRGRDTLAGL